MANIKIAELKANLFEELSDEQLETVVGGGGLLGEVGQTNQDLGNTGTPTTGLLALVANTVVGTGNYLGKVDSGAEKGLQDVNQIGVNATNSL